MSTFSRDILKDPREYYDNYSHSYEEKRKKINYHKLVDQLEANLLKTYCVDKRVLDAGCGPGVMLNQMKNTARFFCGIDLSGEMLKFAQKKELRLVQGRVDQLPFKESTFDVVYSFKVLAHVPEIKQAIGEMARVMDKDGCLILEFYNPYSLRYLIKVLKRPSRISDITRDDQVFTRYDSYMEIKKIIPEYLKVVETRGIRIFTLFSLVHNIPILSFVIGFFERICYNSCLKYFAGFFIVVLKRKQIN